MSPENIHTIKVWTEQDAFIYIEELEGFEERNGRGKLYDYNLKNRNIIKEVNQ